MIAGTKLLKHLDRVTGDKRPITADMFITDYCNNACPYCNFVRYEQRHGQYMDIDHFREYTDRLVSLGIEGVILTGGGEPTINPDFDKITEYLESNNIKYGINTNFNQYRDCNPVYLKVSLDGHSKESYIKRRGVDAYNKTLNNIRRFALNHKNTNIGIQQLSEGPWDVTAFYNAHKELPINYMVFRPVESCGGEFYKNVWNLENAQNIIKAVKELQKADSRIALNYKFDYLQDELSGCPAHWAQLALNTRGEVMYCCHKPHEIVGHIMDKDILQKHEQAVYNIATCDIPCRLTGPNALLREMASDKEAAFL